jgi:hypothetical protein
MSKFDRTYKDISTGKNLGTNSFSMLRYAHNNPGCVLESYEPISKETTQQKFVNVTKQQSIKSESDWTITCNVIRNEEPKELVFEVRKEDWE